MTSIIVSRSRQISALQLAAAIPLPRAHSMRLEVISTFLAILDSLGKLLKFRPNGTLHDASALDIATSTGNVHAGESLITKGAQLRPYGGRAFGFRVAQTELEKAEGYMGGKNLERCAFIIGNWDDEGIQAGKVTNDWTKMKATDESRIDSRWET